MKFVVWLLVCLVCAVAEESPPPADPSPGAPPGEVSPDADRAARFLNLKHLYHPSVDTNEVSPEKKEDPNTALQGLYSDCVLTFSLPCLQKKFLVFLDKLGRMEGFSIIGDFLSVKRTTKETTKPISEKAIEARMNSEGELDSLVEYAIDRFFSTHKLQLKLPFGLSVVDGTEKSRSWGGEPSIIDIAFPQGYSEGRGKKKKMMMMLMMMAKAKLAMLVPLAFILIKVKAVKALFFAKAALALSLFAALKKAGSLGAIGLASAGAGLAGAGAGFAGAGAGKLGGLAGGFGGGGGGGGYGGGGGHGGGGGGQKIVIIHDPHHATSGGGGGGHGHGGGGGGGDSYGPSGGGGGWSSGGGDSYSGGHDSGGWGRSWSPSDGQSLAYRTYNATDKKS